MSKQRIAILGGGISGLSAAYHLSRTQDLRDRYCVTVYQVGWRLGGKLASGRDKDKRNLEHGLHVWFGCYENAFQLLQEIYAARTPPPECPFQTWRSVVKPQRYTPIGVKTDAGWKYVPVEFPGNDGTPGDGKLFQTPWQIVTEVLDLVRIIIERLETKLPDVVALKPPAGLFVDLLHALRSAVHIEDADAASLASEAQTTTRPSVLATVASHWAKSLGANPLLLGPDHPAGIVALFDTIRGGLRGRLEDRTLPADALLMLEAVEIFGASLKGICADLVLTDGRLTDLDNLDFRAWLLKHGADQRVVAESSIIRMVYDTAFLYDDGDPLAPNGAAGVVLGGCMRLVGTYKGSLLWLLQGGMGECVIGPLYDVLVRNGVRFEFFCKVRMLELSEDGKSIGAISIDRQAEVSNAPYRPTCSFKGMTCWPDQPDWGQLQNGAALRDRKVNFESHWCAESPVETFSLRVGADFDTVVLAIAVGAYKRLNDEDPTLSDALVAANSKFADFVNNTSIVPNLSLQLWTTATNSELGWTEPKPAAVAGPEPLNIWADMSQVLAVESWPANAVPNGLHYLTGTYPTTRYMRPAADITNPADAQCEVREIAKNFLVKQAQAQWRLASDGSSFKWDMLADPEGRSGDARLDAQYWRANIDPTECTVGSPVGKTQFRLPAAGFGIANLMLAGEATQQGFNASCVEGSVMSGMAAARAIAGEPQTIIGYDFPVRRLSGFLS